MTKEIFNVDNDSKLTGDENFGLIDGWGDLSDYEDKETVRGALIQGHVENNVWKGVCLTSYNPIKVALRH